MRQSDRAIRQFDSLTPQVVADRVIGFLRAAHPASTAKHVARDTGLPVRTIDKWLERVSAPSACAYTRLWLAYGPEFLAAVAPQRLGWLSAAQQAQRAADLERRQAELDLERGALG